MDRPGKLVLIAEDDPFISRMYKTKLESAGLTVKLVVNGREVVEAIRTQRPSVLMLDLNMPEMTGFEALENLRDNGFDLSNLPIVILTNSLRSEDREKARGFGAEYMVKSDTTPRQVLDIVMKRLEESGVNVGLPEGSTVTMGDGADGAAAAAGEAAGEAAEAAAPAAGKAATKDAPATK